MNDPLNLDRERQYQARQASMTEEVRATPPHVVERYRTTPRWRIYSKEYLFRCIHRLKPRRICDFGCGSGETSTELALLGYDVVGFDLSQELIQQAVQRAKLDGVEDKARFVVSNFEDYGTAQDKFDLVLVQSVLHHTDVGESLATLEKLLVPGGIALIQEPVAFSKSLQWFRDRLPVEKDISPNERQLGRDDIRAICERFELSEIRYFNMFARARRFFSETGNPNRYHQTWHLGGSIDSVLLSAFPFLNYFAGTVVMTCKKR